MGWGSGNGKAEVLNPASGDLIACGSDGDHPFAGKLVFIDVSGLAHKAAKKDSVVVAREGKSLAQLEYVRKRIQSVAAAGGTPVLVLDGRAYPPKLATRNDRRRKAEEARAEAEALELKGDAASKKLAAKAWQEAATPQEPFWLALLDECLRNEILFICAPYEADAQLVSLANEFGERAIIWAAANDSDIVAFGGTDVIYDWDHFTRTYRRVRLLDDILGHRVGKRSFEGWTYDRFLIFTILSGNDYFKNLPGYALTNVYKAMAAASLPSALVAPTPHPALDDRPVAWFADSSLRLYAAPVIDAVARKECWTGGEKEAAYERLLAAYHAVRQHPVGKLVSSGPDALLPSMLEVGIMEPLSSREQPEDCNLGALIPGVEVEADAAVAVDWARGKLRYVDGVLVERHLTPPCERDGEAESADEDKSDDGGDGTPAVAVDNGAHVTSDNVATVSAAQLRAFLHAAGLEYYSNTTYTRMRTLARQLLDQGAPAALKPFHPALHRHTRPNRHLRLQSSAVVRGSALFDVVRRLGDGGVKFDSATRNAFLPFPSTQARGLRLYDSEGTSRRGKVQVGSRSHAHSHSVTMQRAVYSPPGQPAVEAYIFRMAVHASMRQVDHVAMLAVTRHGILLAPNSICSCEVGIECSHLYCLLIVLHVMQSSDGYADFVSRVLVYDKAKAPSGDAVWWPDKYPICYEEISRSPDAKLSLDRKVFDVTDASASASPVVETAHVSGGEPGYHHSSRHVDTLRRLCFHFRHGQVAALVRAEHGDVVAPPPVELGVDDDSDDGSNDGECCSECDDSDEVGSHASVEPSPVRPGPERAGYGSPFSPHPPLTPRDSAPRSSPNAPSGGPSKRLRSRQTPLSRRLQY